LEPIEDSLPIIGQAFQQGPVIIIWDAALHDGRHPESGHNVVYHEFAHKLDMLDGAADGTPPLWNRTEYRDWVQICSREYLRLRHDVEHGKDTFINAYGATSEAEFFAVATEQFFDRPLLIKKRHLIFIVFLKNTTVRIRHCERRKQQKGNRNISSYAYYIYNLANGP